MKPDIMTEKRSRKQNQAVLCILAMVAVSLLVSCTQFRTGRLGYYNCDATWHTLFTMQCYDETPPSTHHFLPLTSLGRPEDKHIPWGGAIPDKEGNFYYTSFSPAGFALPYFFVKLCSLPITEGSLYLFNSLLLALSTAIWLGLIGRVYKESRFRTLLMVTAGIVYILSPVVLHNMGIVYWGQSVMQVVLAAQFYGYYRYRFENNAKFMPLFYILCVFAPYAEWTGFVANMGFALAELCCFWGRDKKKAFGRAFLVGLLTVLAGILLVGHFLTALDPAQFFEALQGRFVARNFSSSRATFMQLIQGYGASFGMHCLLLLVLCIWALVQNKKIVCPHKIMLLVIAFPILENLIMKQHAVMYHFDQMKVGFLLSFAICGLLYQILASSKRKFCAVVLLIMTAASGAINLVQYNGDTEARYTLNYGEDNQAWADYILEHYEDAVLASSTEVRGYQNLLFHCGIYERMDLARTVQIAEEENRAYGIYIEDERCPWNMNRITGAYVYDCATEECRAITYEQGVFTETVDEGALTVDQAAVPQT